MVPCDPISIPITILDRRDHDRVPFVNVNDGGRRRCDGGCAIVVRRNSAKRPIIVDRGQNKSDLVLDVLVVGKGGPGPDVLLTNLG